MLGRLRMSVDECIKIYPDMASRIFANPRVSLGGILQNKYNTDVLETVLQKIVSERLNGADSLDDFPCPKDLCRT